MKIIFILFIIVSILSMRIKVKILLLTFLAWPLILHRLCI